MTYRRDLTRPMPATVQPAAEPSAHHLCTARPCAVALPIDFTAFCELRYAVYLRYARVHLHDRDGAENAVRTSLRELATAWPRLLRRPHLAQSAWQVLTQHVQDSVRQQDPYRAKTLLGLIYRALTPDQADATVLRYLLELTVDQTADLMGADSAAVAYWLRSAQRQLGENLDSALRRTAPERPIRTPYCFVCQECAPAVVSSPSSTGPTRP
jgi:hypothetical protein